MFSISAICEARSAPIARPVVAGPDGVAGVVVAPAPAGEGVAGIAAAVEPVDCTGAAGGAGVDTLAGAGVEGAFEEEAELDGAALG